MANLGVNVDHVATVRQARGIDEPDPVYAAMIAEEAGATCITVHLREDRRHIQDRDLYILKQVVKTKLNLEMGLFEDVIEVALKVKPHNITIVPERRQELTTEGGLDVVKYFDDIKKYVEIFNKEGITVSLFIDPEIDQIKASKETNAQAVELHTGRYADAKDENTQKQELERIIKASEEVLKNNLILNAGHGLNYRNVVPVARIKGMNELNIGHSIVARAIFVGFKEAVKEMVYLVRGY